MWIYLASVLGSLKICLFLIAFLLIIFTSVKAIGVFTHNDSMLFDNEPKSYKIVYEILIYAGLTLLLFCFVPSKADFLAMSNKEINHIIEGE